jgi:NADH-quinone oxidoreductase subunit M
MAIGAVGIVYGAVLAFAQTDLKRLVAYTSVSHLGFVLLGIFAGGALALQGVTLQMVCHGLSTGALFILAGALQERLGTRDLRQMGGFWAVAPRMGALAMLFAMASLGLPGLGNFVAELLVLLGSFAASVSITAVATAALVLATVYSLWIVQRVFHGPRPQAGRATWSDLSPRETLTLAAMAVALVWLGLFPQPVIDVAAPALAALELP